MVNSLIAFGQFTLVFSDNREIRVHRLKSFIRIRVFIGKHVRLISSGIWMQRSRKQVTRKNNSTISCKNKIRPNIHKTYNRGMQASSVCNVYTRVHLTASLCQHSTACYQRGNESVLEARHCAVLVMQERHSQNTCR